MLPFQLAGTRHRSGRVCQEHRRAHARLELTICFIVSVVTLAAPPHHPDRVAVLAAPYHVPYRTAHRCQATAATMIDGDLAPVTWHPHIVPL
jgi:hypothetical protein